MDDFNILLDRINNAKALDFGDVLNESIELFKKVWLKGLVVVLFVIISAVCISLVFNLIGLAPVLNPNIFNDGFDFKTFAEFYSSSAIYGIPQNMLISTLNLAFVGAFYRICIQIASGENALEDFFYFFNKVYFTKVFLLGIIYTGIASIAQFLLFIPYIYAFVPLSYFAVILANNPDLSEIEIVKASFALGNKKWLLTFGAMIVATLMAMLGIIACFIGVVFTISFIYLPVFVIYKNAIGFDDKNTNEELGATLE